MDKILTMLSVWGLVSVTAPALHAESLHEINLASPDVSQWGTGRVEHYDAAIRLDDPLLAGAEVVSVEMPFEAVAETTGWSLWLSSGLKLDNKQNVADLGEWSVTPEDGRLRLELPAPVLLPEGGLYVGCSFDVTGISEGGAAPLTVSAGTEGGLYLHTSRKYLKWGDYDLGLALDMTVTLRGDFSDEEVRVVLCRESASLPGEGFRPTFVVRNTGVSPVSSIGYVVTLDGEEYRGEADFDPALPATGTAEAEVEALSLNPAEAGEYEWQVRVESVNGVANACDESAAGRAYVYARNVGRRPLYEEYTGIWCGWCPRGAVAMRLMRDMYGDDFVGVAYHTGDDAMNVGLQPAVDYPGAPSCTLDRHVTTDPFYGELEYSATVADGIAVLWNRVRQTPSPVELKAAALKGEEGLIHVSASAEFVRPWHDADLRWVCMIVADGLTGRGSGWNQSNYYSDMDRYRGGDLDGLVDSPRYLTGGPFDDVLVASPDTKGVPGSLPSEIEWLTPYEEEWTFDLSEVRNTAGELLSLDEAVPSAVLAVVDGVTSRVLNAIRVAVTDESDVRMTPAPAEVLSVEYFTPDGIRRPLPSASGVTLRVETLSDGTRRVRKCAGS